MSQGPSHKKTMTFSQSALLKKDREARYNVRIKRTLDELVPISEKSICHDKMYDREKTWPTESLNRIK